MKVADICQIIEEVAPLALCESYDNVGLLVGDPRMELRAVLLCIDVTEAVLDEALQKGCNMIVSHHPLIFRGVKSLTGKDAVQRCMIKAIKNDLAIYAAHTNIDAVLHGVSGRMAEKIGLLNTRILEPRSESLLKLVTFVPHSHADMLRQALFDAGAGNIGNYDCCSYNVEGYGSFRAGEQAQPFVGKKNEIHKEPELRIEVILPALRQAKIITALLHTHPYEEPAFDIYPLRNEWKQVGFGIVGDLKEPENEIDFLLRLKTVFRLKALRHSPLLAKPIQRVALCGGSGSFLLNRALDSKADIYISGDFKYHEFFNAENRIVIADVGHFESEQFTTEIFYEAIRKKIPTFAVRISDVITNPVNYL